MAGQSYPSPNSSAMASGAAPFFASHSGVPSDLDLAQELTHHNQQHDAQMQAAAQHHHQHGAHGAHGAGHRTPDQSQEDVQNAFLHDQLSASVAESAHQAAAAAAAAHLSTPSQGMMGQGTPSSDRSGTKKASRACDECRRKKIRCDATPDNPNKPCLNCQKANHRCEFSRQPMKRGPSKGYIKELADRVSDLERIGSAWPPIMPPGEEHLLVPTGRDDRLPLVGRDLARKRLAEMHAEAEARRLNPPPPPSEPNASTFFGIGAPSGSIPSMSQSDAVPTQEQAAAAVTNAMDTDLTAVLFEWDEEVVDAYYRVIHLSMPILPDTRESLRMILGQCPQSVRDAFLATLDWATRSSPAAALPAPAANAMQRAADLIHTSLYESAGIRTPHMQLVFLWCYMNMALAAAMAGPSRAFIGPPAGEWLGRAAGLAKEMHANVVQSRPSISEQPDSLESLGRRVWWALFVLDRFHSTSASTSVAIDENAGTLLPEDEYLLGPIAYNLVRLAHVAGHVVEVLQRALSSAPAASTDLTLTVDPSTKLVNKLLSAELDRVQETLDSFDAENPRTVILHSMYWYVRLLIMRLTPVTEAGEVATVAARLAGILKNPAALATPVAPYIAAFVATTLIEVLDSSTPQPVQPTDDATGTAAAEATTTAEPTTTEATVEGSAIEAHSPSDTPIAVPDSDPPTDTPAATEPPVPTPTTTTRNTMTDAAMQASAEPVAAHSETINILARHIALAGLHDLSAALGACFSVAHRDAPLGWFALIAELLQSKLALSSPSHSGEVGVGIEGSTAEAGADPTTANASEGVKVSSDTDIPMENTTTDNPTATQASTTPSAKLTTTTVPRPLLGLQHLADAAIKETRAAQAAAALRAKQQQEQETRQRQQQQQQQQAANGVTSQDQNHPQTQGHGYTHGGPGSHGSHMNMDPTQAALAAATAAAKGAAAQMHLTFGSPSGRAAGRGQGHEQGHEQGQGPDSSETETEGQRRLEQEKRDELLNLLKSSFAGVFPASS